VAPVEDQVKIVDPSTAHRVAKTTWAFGFQMSTDQRHKIKASNRVSIPVLFHRRDCAIRPLVRPGSCPLIGP
jgi:hypothetical protein